MRLLIAITRQDLIQIGELLGSVNTTDRTIRVEDSQHPIGRGRSLESFGEFVTHTPLYHTIGGLSSYNVYIVSRFGAGGIAERPRCSDEKTRPGKFPRAGVARSRFELFV